MIYPPNPSNIRQAAELIRAGKLVAFPTETVYGLGADAFNEEAVREIFRIKNRPVFNPLIVHLHSSAQIELVADLSRSPAAQALLNKAASFWPGPLSVVVPKQPLLPLCVTGGLESVAIRVPAHDAAMRLLKECGCPIAAPSANLFSEVSPTTAEHVAESFGDKLGFVLDGGQCEVGLESTVLSLLESPPRLLRPGAVTIEQLEAALGPITRASAHHTELNAPLSPGMLMRHYAPTTPIAFKDEMDMENCAAERVGLLCFSSESSVSDGFDYAAVTSLSIHGDLKLVAARLFAALREMDKLELDLIVVDACAPQGIGLAIMDRLRRAAFRK
jgi:L-threonylcarbamoyladenylate synthase